MEHAPKFGPFGCFLKKLFKKKKFRPTDPTFSEIPHEGNTTIIFFWPNPEHEVQGQAQEVSTCGRG